MYAEASNSTIQGQVADLLSLGQPVEHALPLGRELQFILAGKAAFTIRSTKTSTRFTLKVTQAKNKTTGDREQRWFVSVLTGPNNDTDFVYMGQVYNGVFTTSRASQVSPEAPSFIAFGWVYNRLSAGKVLPNCEIWHAGHCGRCGRTLTVPESIELGLGPECASKGF